MKKSTLWQSLSCFIDKGKKNYGGCVRSTSICKADIEMPTNFDRKCHGNRFLMKVWMEKC